MIDQSARLLFVEDDPQVCLMLEEALREAGYAVDSAGTVADGQSLLDTGTYDLLLTDGRLPDGNGFSIATKAAAKGVRVLIYTGYMYEYSETDRASFTVLAKPIRISQLLRTIRNSLRNAP